jgi:hypothetical protein
MSEPTRQQRQQQRVDEFITALERLDNAGRARLKRNAGRSLHEARDVHRIFYRALPYEVAGRLKKRSTSWSPPSIHSPTPAMISAAWERSFALCGKVGQARASTGGFRRCLIVMAKTCPFDCVRQCVLLRQATSQSTGAGC